MPPARQLSLLPVVTTPDPGADHGEVFTRRWVVEMILDLVGYTPDRDLGAMVLVEPSCGTGAFLVPVVERLIASCAAHGRDLETIGGAIRAFDLLEANAERARKACADLLARAGLDDGAALDMASSWVGTGDFLLTPGLEAKADVVVGNPPYVRLENVAPLVMEAYRAACPTMRGRADIYVGFIERGLQLLKPGGVLSYICADRWMRNQYGADLRELVTGSYAVEAVISMHDVDAFEDDVSAYPAVVVLRNGPQGSAAVVEASGAFRPNDARHVVRWVTGGRTTTTSAGSYEATKVGGWFSGRDLWPAGSPLDLATIADLEARFRPLEDLDTGTKVGIGLATGCDDVFITSDPHLVERDRLLPLLQAPDLAGGAVAWRGQYLVNPWGERGLVDLEDHPRLAAHLRANAGRLRARYVARQRPGAWYRTIDKVDASLVGRPKLLLPDIKAAAHPVLDRGGFYPHHNLYHVTSTSWDLEVLGGLLLSDVANLFVGAYCVKMRGGAFRFQAQYLRRIRVPDPSDVPLSAAEALRVAFRARDRRAATVIAADLYGVELGLEGGQDGARGARSVHQADSLGV